MAISISKDTPILGTQRFLKSNTTINNSTERTGNGSNINRVIDDAVVENRNAAESTITETANPKEIAILTKNYMLKDYSPNMEKQTNS